MDDNLAVNKKKPIFANGSDEPCGALAMDVGKEIPILKGETATRFLQNMAKTEEEHEKLLKKPPTLNELETEYSLKKMFLEMERKSLLAKEKELKELKEKIKKLKKVNGEN